jgi:hypothetical protein
LVFVLSGAKKPLRAEVLIPAACLSETSTGNVAGRHALAMMLIGVALFAAHALDACRNG